MKVKEKIRDFFNSFFSFKGRIKRLTYFWSLVILFFLCLFDNMFSIIFSVSVEKAGIPSDSILYLIALIIYVSICFFVIFGLFTATIKRFHDINMSGWWSLSLFFFGLLVPLVLLFVPSKNKDNIYGNCTIKEKPNRGDRSD